MKKTRLNVKGMHCRSCEILIKDSLQETEGIANVELSHEKGTANIAFDESKINESKIKNVIEKEGYKVI